MSVRARSGHRSARSGSGTPRTRARLLGRGAITTAPGDGDVSWRLTKLATSNLHFIAQQVPDLPVPFREMGVGTYSQEVPRPWEVDIDDRLDSTRLGSEDSDPIRHHQRLVNRMGNEDDRLAGALPDIEHFVLQHQFGLLVK